MKLKAYILHLFLFCFGIQFSFGQSQSVVDRTKEELKSLNKIQNPSIEEQFQYILDKSYNYTADEIPFEVIKNRYILAFKENLTDSLALLQKKIKAHNSVVDGLHQQIRASTDTIKQLESDKSDLSTQTSTINILGIAIEKSLFKLIVLSVLIVLIIVVVVLISKLKKANEIVEEAKSEAEAAQKEQEKFRRTSMEREQKLKRELLNLSKQNTSTISSSTNTTTSAPKKEAPKKSTTTAKKSPKK